MHVKKSAKVNQEGSNKGLMRPSDGFWKLLTALEQDLPLTEDKLQFHLQLVFKSERDGSRRKVLVSTSVAANAYGVALSSVRFHPGVAESQGDLLLEMAASGIQQDALENHFPDGSWSPPSPPGYGPRDAGPVYSVNRQWGRFFFAFVSGELRRVSFDFGGHGSPGI